MKEKYTILLIPPGCAPAKKFEFSLHIKKIIGIGALTAATLILALAAHDLFQLQYIRHHDAAYAQVEQLQNTLQEKEKEIAHLNESASNMTENLSQISALEDKIAGILKLQPPRDPVLAQGGVQAIPQSYSPSRGVDQSTSIVAEHLGLLQDYYQSALKFQDKSDHTPSILPVEGEIASLFGYRKNPFGGWSQEFHNGVDIACDYGTPVRATADGTVTYSGWDGVYGRKVEIDHGNGIVTFYGHNSKLIVKVGQEVKKGEVIAYSGNSGRSTGAHLHYGAIVNGKNTDPLLFTNFTKEQ